MVLSKFVIYNCVIYIVYKLLNKYKSNNIKTNISKQSKQPKSNITLKDIYENYHIKKKINYDQIDPNILNLMNKNNEKDIIITNNILLNDNKNNILLNDDNKFLKYTFNSKKDYSYKIKFNLDALNINNIKLIISNNKKNFTYNYDEYNIMKDKIYKYGFILDNNIFEDDKIDIYILMYNNENILNINNVVIEITEKQIIIEKKPVLIITINKKNTPIYLETYNIIYG